ncbi:peptide chain release factor 1-like, mitochondrial isoform X1 [Mytilus californianus]|uniref:peptide chain release factor 1-like, mitochondrial isoform X1 n=1 Tax=Mytilus californianus TaxID=6549 RepID=UPI002246F010|nr:peptide chain release factor 1-like, mitochondrial isoform X1 [Mytilus californianus]
MVMQRINFCFGKTLYRIKQKWNPVMTWCKYSHMLSSVRAPCCMLKTRKGLLLSQLTVRCRTLQTHVHAETAINSGRHCRPLQKCYMRNGLFIFTREYASLQNVDDGLLIKYLDSLNVEYNDILELYRTGKKTKEMGSRRVFLEPIVDVYSGMKEKYNELEELKLLVEEDEEMKTMADSEFKAINQQINDMKQQILDILVPDLKYDKNDAILEINPGVGGEEAKLFTLDLCNMYQKYISYKGWSVELETSQSKESGGLAYARLLISGYDVFKTLKYESGIHRVQRVPETERGGRIHTSTSAVAILPQPTEIDIIINPNDLHIDTFKSSGPGGQSVQKNDTAVRLTHTPSGVVTSSQESRSQIQNKKSAMNRLREKLYEIEFNAQMSKMKSQRKVQVGTKGRSEKIRTYNFPQNRVTDHRIHYTSNIQGILSGEDVLDELINQLHEESRKETLIEMLQEFESKGTM